MPRRKQKEPRTQILTIALFIVIMIMGIAVATGAKTITGALATKGNICLKYGIENGITVSSLSQIYSLEKVGMTCLLLAPAGPNHICCYK